MCGSPRTHPEPGCGPPQPAAQGRAAPFRAAQGRARALARRINPWLFMITKEKHAYRMLFLRQNGITPIAEVSRGGEFLF